MAVVEVRGLAPHRRAIHHSWGFAGKPTPPNKRSPGQLWKRPAVGLPQPEGEVIPQSPNTVPVEIVATSDESPIPIFTVNTNPANSEVDPPLYIAQNNTDGIEAPVPPPGAQPPADVNVESLSSTAPPVPVNPPPKMPEGGDDCSKCFIIYKYVNVYYPPAASSVTDCLTEMDLAGVPTPTIPPGLLRDREPGSVYVEVPELSAGNACTKITEFTSLTFTFAPGELSTIQGPANITKEFDFADLPCPPPDVASDAQWFYNPAFNPTQTYAPLVAPFSQLYDLHPAFKDCIVADNQGFDPSTALPPVDAPTVPQPGKGRLGPQLGARVVEPLKRQDGPAVAHRVAYMPSETGSIKPSNKDQGRN
ncbi:MAG: hypothetical protein Q9185_006601 [Variospora sp. 1 TL-2023]